MNKADITAAHIWLDAGGRRVLSIRLSADGSIKRMGSGGLPILDETLHIGTVTEEPFLEFMSHVSDDLLKYAGVYNMSPVRGVPCKLEIIFQGTNKTNAYFKFNYGSESDGPFAEIHELVIAAIAVTDKWLEQKK